LEGEREEIKQDQFTGLLMYAAERLRHGGGHQGAIALLLQELLE
jgi:hypothetical protein